PRADESLGEPSGREPSDIPFAGKLHREEWLRIPGARPEKPVERSRIETAKQPADLRVEPALLRRARFQLVLPPVVRARRNDDTGRDFERLCQPFTGGIGVDLPPLAAAEPPMERREEAEVALPA